MRASSGTQGVGSTVRFGPFELQIGERRLLQDGRPVPLRARPFELLAVLVARAGQLVSKDELLDLAWPGVIVEENNLQVQVSVLRKLLGPNAIDTVPGFGYRFAMPIGAGAGTSHAAPTIAPTMQARRGGGASRSPLIGRAAELDALATLCRNERLVTVLGIGGVGKTRLVSALVERLAPEFAAGASFVELAELNDPALVVVHIARALGLDVTGDGNAARALAATLAEAPRLLVLDNAEHLVEPLAALVADALAAAPALHVLVTSQAPLQLDGEQLFRLGPLPVPSAADNIATALHEDAVGLFVARAQAADRRFGPDADDLAAVIEICRRLDGLPLAIELAAARVPLLGVRGLLEQLDKLDWLSDRRAARPARQQTLEATLDWSHGLLSPLQQVVFRRLGVFAGAFSLAQACDAVCESGLDEATMLDGLGALVDRGLVQAVHEHAPRYRLLEAARLYAMRRLAAAGESDVLARASQACESAGDRAQAGGLVVQSLADYSHALELVQRLPADARRAERELDLGLKLGPVVQAILGPSHPRSEALYRMAVERAGERAPDARTFRALWGHWHFLCMCGRNREAAPVADELVRLAPSLRNEALELEAAHAAMTSQDLLGNADAVVEHARRVIAAYEPDRHHALAFAFGGHDPGVCAYGQGAWGAWLAGRPDEALALATDAIRLADTMDDGYSRATGYYYASFVHAACGDAARFDETARALLAISREHGLEALVVEAELIAGCARFACGDRDSGLEAMRGALARIEASGDLAFVLVYVAFVAEALLAVGANHEAAACLKRGLGHANAGQGVYLPEMHRLLAQVAFADGDAVLARLEVGRALAIADRQNAHGLALRAALTGAQVGAPGAEIELRERRARIVGGENTRDVALASDLLTRGAALTR